MPKQKKPIRSKPADLPAVPTVRPNRTWHFREESGFSKKDLSVLANLSERTILRIERIGHSNVRRENLFNYLIGLNKGRAQKGLSALTIKDLFPDLAIEG